MTEQNPTNENQMEDEIHSRMKCKVCGACLYLTDRGNHERTYHCSSEEARFWDFERGTPAQLKAKEHWDKSRIEMFTDMSQAL
ncbi:MAG TPA: hypothetical protein VKT28_14030 [Puia sp.]|nr:hypothetical protein [Puia sp.]